MPSPFPVARPTWPLGKAYGLRPRARLGRALARALASAAHGQGQEPAPSSRQHVAAVPARPTDPSGPKPVKTLSRLGSTSTVCARLGSQAGQAGSLGRAPAPPRSSRVVDGPVPRSSAALPTGMRGGSALRVGTRRTSPCNGLASQRLDAAELRQATRVQLGGVHTPLPYHPPRHLCSASPELFMVVWCSA